MAKDLQQALDSVRNTARSFRAVIELADAVEGMASVEQAINDANARLSALQREVGISQAQLNTAREAIDASNKSAQAIVASANADKEDILARAKKKAAEIITNAETTKRGADAYEKDIHANAKAHKEDYDLAIAARARELNELNAKVEKVRAKMAEMLK